MMIDIPAEIRQAESYSSNTRTQEAYLNARWDGDVAATSQMLSRAFVRRLVRDLPERVLELLDRTDLPPSELTFIAELAGEIPSNSVAAPLVRLLSHPSPLVREGAIYGLARHRSPAIDQHLRSVTMADPSPGVREAAAELLGE